MTTMSDTTRNRLDATHNALGEEIERLEGEL